MKNRVWPLLRRIANQWSLTPLILLVLLLAAIHPAAAVTVTASNGLSCAGTRSATNLGCTAGEFTTIVNITNAPGAPTSCVAGEYIFYNGTVSLSGTNADRYDIGFFTGENGNDPGLNNASNFCSVATFPTTPLPWIAKDADACGDFSAAGVDNAAINSIKVLCAGDATGAMMIPYTLVYSQNVGIACTGPTNVVGGSTSKCNKGIAVVPVATFTVNGSVTVTKQTVPDIDPQSFAFTASGTGPVMTGDTSFNLTDNVSKQVRMGISGTNQTLTITETAADTNLWEPTATIACTLPDGITPAGFVATNGATRTITATLSNTNPNALCTLTNTRRTTTLATGTDPVAATIAPGAAATDVDLFTLQTSGGTETITSVTVNLSTSNGVGRLAIINNAGTELGFTTSPTTGPNTIAVAGMSATTTSASTPFKVRITPLSHAAMPVPPGGAYAITAHVTAWAGPNIHTGTDTNTNALTIDNLSPTGATATSGSTGDAKVTLNWTTSSSSDFALTSGSVVYRWAAASAGTEVPAEGSTPTLGSVNGTATVACLVDSSASTPLTRIDGTGGSADCTTAALTNGQPYTYKVFQKDSNGNYDTSVAGGTFTPGVTTATTTLATGTDPAAATIGPGAAATDVDLFTLQTSSGTEAITSVTVNLSTNSGVGRLAITNNAGTELGFTASPVTGSNTITVSGMSATTTLTTFKVRVTPLSHAAMPAPPGAAYAITAPVTAWAGPNTHAGSDTNLNALTIDNLSPNGATATSGSTGDARMTLNWTTSSSSDFALTSGSVVYRWASASAGTEVPAEGSTPTLGSVNGTATVACLVSSSAPTPLTRIDGTGGSADCTTAALTNGQPYTYKIFQKDSNGNYDTGVESVALPLITKTNGVSEINPGATTTYTVTISNNLGGTLQNMVFTDPAVTNLTVSNVSCTAAAGATCPAMTSAAMITAMQGAGITILSAELPSNSSLTFTISATLLSGATVGSNLVNSARVTIASRFVEATDTDLIVTAPSAAMSFSPSMITEGGASLLTITLTNYFSSAITGVAFTDTYPAGMVNTASANWATTCGGTVTAANNGNSLALSGTIPASGSCTVTVNVTSATAGSYANSTGIITTSGNPIPAASATLTVNAAAGGSFVFTDAICQHGIAFGAPGQTCSQVVWPTQTAGVNATAVYITAVNTSNVPTRLHATQARTRNMEFGLSCHDPIANAGVQATFEGVTLPLCQASGAMPTTWSSPVTTVTFPGGSPSSNVSYTFNYADVGRVELWMRNNATPTETGNGGAFVVKPAGFVLSNIKCTTANAANCAPGALPSGSNPAAVNAAGPSFIQAGNMFSVTVSSIAQGGAVTPSYGRESVAEGVLLNSYLIAPTGGATGTLAGTTTIPGATFQGATKGVATVSDLNWSEVGIIGLAANVADGNYLGGSVGTTGSISSGSTTLTVSSPSNIAVGSTMMVRGAGSSGAPLLTTVNAVVGTTVTLASAATTTVNNAPVYDIYGTSPNVGRFIPHHFDTVTAGPMACLAVTGTVDVTLGSAAVTGVGTSFLTELSAGRGVTIAGADYTVASIASATSLTLTKAYTGANANGLAISPCPSGGLVYSRQAFSAIVTAKNALTPIGTTANYDNTLGLAKAVTLSAVASDGGAVIATTAPGGTLSANTVAAAAFASGSSTVTVPAPVFSFAIEPTVPTDVYIRAEDADAVSSLRSPVTVSLEGGVKVVSGRLKIPNAYGSEKLSLTVRAAAQYYNGSSWVPSVTDNVTSLTLAASYNVVKNSVTTGTTTPAPTGVATLTGGILSIVLGIPTGGATGNATINPTTPVYLPLLPGQATFGVYGGAQTGPGRNEFIYMRENY